MRPRPYYAREGWADRYRVREVFAAVVELAVIFALLAVGFLYIWLGAPEGAGYPA